MVTLSDLELLQWPTASDVSCVRRPGTTFFIHPLYHSQCSTTVGFHGLQSFVLAQVFFVLVAVRPVVAVLPVWFWPDHFFTQAQKKIVPCRVWSVLYVASFPFFECLGIRLCFTAWQRRSSKYSNNVATHYSTLVTTDCSWYRPQAWSPALWCGYEIETRTWFCVHEQHAPVSISECLKFQNISLGGHAPMLWPDHLNLACFGLGLAVM